MLGGPMYTLERGLGWRKMGMLFAVFTAIAAFGIGCTVQANAISTIMHASYGISTEVSGGVLMLLSAAVIIGGVRSVSKVCSMLVPLMALLYVLGCIFILCVNAGYVMPALRLIVCSGILAASRRWRFCRCLSHHGCPLRHCPRSVQQRVRTWFGSYRCCRCPHQESGTPGFGFLHRHFLGHGGDMCAHRTRYRKQHHCLS